MEIDIFPIPHRKDGMARNFDKGFIGILIISYRKEWNSIADHEEMEEHIAQNFG